LLPPLSSSSSPLTSTSPSPSPLIYKRLSSHHGPYVQRRSFHVIQAAQDVLTSVHTVTGTPWALTIPLVAVGVNLLFRWPFNVYAHQVMLGRSRITPVLRAWFLQVSSDVKKERIPLGKQQAQVNKRFKAEANRVYRALGLQQWRMYLVWLGVPAWLITFEGIRRLCGSGHGLVGMLLGYGRPGTTPEASASSAPLSTTTGTEIVVPAAGDPALLVDPTAATDVASSVSSSIDPSLTTEGMLWFTDLTTADPYSILPYAVSAMMVVSLIPQGGTARRVFIGEPAASKIGGGPEPAEMTTNITSRLRLMVHRTMILLSLAIGPITSGLPAAIHLYWFTSTASVLAFRQFLKWRMPPTGAKAGWCNGTRELPVIKAKFSKQDVALKPSKENKKP
jgi:inner membrane protein COX18